MIVAIADQFHVRDGAEGARGRQARPGREADGRGGGGVRDARRGGRRLRARAAGRHDAPLRSRHRLRAGRSSREQIGEVLAMRAWYCDSAYRYEMTDALQPLVESSRRRGPARGRPEGRSPPLLPARPRQPSRRPRALPVRRHRQRPRAAGGEVRRVLAGSSAREFADGSIGHLDLTMAVRMDWFEGFHVYGEHGSVVAKSFPAVVPALQRGRVLLRPRPQLPPAARRRRPRLPPPDRGVRRHDPRRRAAGTAPAPRTALAAAPRAGGDRALARRPARRSSSPRA